MNQIKLGDEVLCKVSGYRGVAIARTQWLNGCVRFTVQPKVDKDGKYVGCETFDEPQLELLFVDEAGLAQPATTGGPIPAPQRAPDPTR